MKVRPLQDRILVKRVEEKETVKGGIIIPDTAKEKPQEGTVIAIGSGKLDDNGKRIPLEVKVGDKVLFGKYSGNEIKIDDVEHVILRGRHSRDHFLISNCLRRIFLNGR